MDEEQGESVQGQFVDISQVHHLGHPGSEHITRPGDIRDENIQ